jgi:hypothetical protein
VLAVHSLLEGVHADVRYAAAFTQEPRSDISPTSYTPESLCGHRSGLYDAIRAMLSTWWTRIKNRSVRNLKSDTVTDLPEIAPTSTPKYEPDSNLPDMQIISTGARNGPCGYSAMIEVHCDNSGDLRDSAGNARGRCPYCGVGRKA